MSSANLEAIKAAILRANKWGRVSNLFGPANADARQEIMTLIVGKKLPKAKCGVNAVEAAVKQLAREDGVSFERKCLAEQDAVLKDWLMGPVKQ